MELSSLLALTHLQQTVAETRNIRIQYASHQRRVAVITRLLEFAAHRRRAVKSAAYTYRKHDYSACYP